MSFDGNTLSTAESAAFASGQFLDSFTISSTDVDMIRIDLIAGHTYQFDEDNLASGDLYLRIFDAFGNEVRAVDDGAFSNDDVVLSTSPYALFMPNYSGTYYVALSSTFLRDYDPTTTAGRVLPENPFATFSGELRITDLGATADFPGANAIGASGLTAEGVNDETDVFREDDGSLRVQYEGAFEFATDVDIGRIDLAKGDWIVVDVNGLQGNGSVLRIFNSAGTQIGFDSGSGTGSDAELNFIAPLTSIFYVGISGTGNTAYNVVDGTGTLAGVVGDFEVIFHRNPTQVGTNGSNFFTGNAKSNYIVALSANDTVSGNDGDDTLAGGDDADLLSGGNGQDILYGEHGEDELSGNNGSDVLSGGIGNDQLFGGKGTDLLEGGSGNDSLSGGEGLFADTLRGDSGDDSLLGVTGNDSLSGGDGNDLLNGGTGDDTLFSNFGDDDMLGGLGNDLLVGDTGNDTLQGQGGNDGLFGNNQDDDLLGGSGDDRLDGGFGNDLLTGGTGADQFEFFDVSGLDTIADFELGIDRIDLAAIFAGTGSVVTALNLAQFVQVTPSGAGADSFLAIDANGAVGGLSFTILAQVNGITTAELFDFNNFLV